MISQHRTRAGLAATLALASLAASASPALADPNPDQRAESTRHAAELAQERYYMGHKPAITAPGHDFRTIDARDAADAPDGAVTRATAPVTAHAVSADDFEWADAAIGAGSALVLVLAGGAVAVTRRNRGRTGGVATS